jgi:hypothetical protein
VDPISPELQDTPNELLEPLDDWVHLQPSIDEDRKGRIYLPANVEGTQLLRCVALAVGSKVDDIHVGDLVLALSGRTIDLRDGTKLVRREHVVARLGG